MTRQYDNYADLITFSRSSGGTALRPISYGSELVTNGTFDSDLNGWTLSNSPAWVSGRVELSRNGGIDIVRQSFATTIGAVYKVTADVTGTSGKLGIGVSSLDDSILNADALVNTSVDRLFVATTNTTWIYLITEVNGTSSWDNVSVKEVLFDDASGDLTLFNHPADIPRIEYDADGNVLGLLVEESRTNLVTYSEDFSNASWNYSAFGLTISSNVIEAPDGSLTADKLEETATREHHRRGISESSGVARRFSFFAKAAERTLVRCWSFSGGNTSAVHFDLENVTVTANTLNATIEDAGNGWYRCSADVDSPNTSIVVGPSDSLARSTSVYTGTAGSGIYIWGAQLEAGAFPTSYIPTSGATATRSADVASIPVSAFGYRQGEGTFFAEVNLFGSGWNPVISPQIGATRYNELRRSSDGLADFTNLGITPAGLWPDNVFVKVTGSSKAGDSVVIIDGGTPSTSTGSLSKEITSLRFGSNNSNEKINGHIKSIQYYPRRLTNAQLQELTT